MLLDDRQITRLLDIANAGCHKGCVAQARRIFDGVLAVRPDHVPALIGRAYSFIVVDECGTAADMLRNDVLAGHPDDPDGLAFLGLALFFGGKRDEAAEILAKVPADSSARSLADSLAGELN